MTLPRRGAVVAALPLALVLAVNPAGLAPFGPAKALALFALVPAAATMWLRGHVRVDRTSARAWVLFLVIAAAAAALGLDGLYAWTGTPERHFGWLTWLLCATAFLIGQQLDPRFAKTVAITTAIAIGGAGVWVVAELIGWHPIALAGAGTRPVGPFGSSAYLGAAAVLLGPIAVAATAGSRRIAIPTGALAAVALIASGARAAWVGALVAGAAWLVVRGAPKRLGALLGAVAIAAVFAFGVAGRVPDLISDRDGGARGRLDEWRVATRVIEQRPLLGVGPEGYRIAFGRQVDTAYEQRHGRDPLPDRAHSAILDVVATTGVLGALVYVALLGLVGRGAIRALRSGSTLYAAMAIGLIGYIAQSLFLFPIAELDPLAWLFAGILVAATVDLTSVRISRVVRPVAAVLAVVALVAGVLDVVADRQAKRAVAALADEQLPRGDGPRRLRPDVLSYHLLEARAGEARGTPSGFRDALTAVDRALRISHRDPVARMEQGRLQLEQARVTGEPRDMARAVATLKRLVAGDPHNAAAWLRLGVASAVAGDDRGAESAWKQAARLAPRSAAAPVDLALAYVRQQRWAEARTEAARAIARDPGNPEATEVLRQANGTDRTR